MRLNESCEKFGDQVQFFNIYIAEAHPSDGWAMPRNMDEDIVYAAPTTIGERVDVAQACLARVRFAFPTLVDGIDDEVDIAYAAHPTRIYVIDKDGKVAFRGGMGPAGLNVDGAMEAIEEQAALVG